MWTEIMTANRGPLRESAEAMIEKLREFIKLLERDQSERDSRINDFLTEAKVRRDQLRMPRLK
jgi:prephenate dehydrogenase